MTIIQFKINYKKYDDPIGWAKMSDDKTKTIKTIHHLESDLQNANIKITKCNPDCECNTIKNKIDLHQINDLVEINDIEDSNEFIDSIKDVIENNIYVKISDLFEDSFYSEYDTLEFDIRNLISKHSNDSVNKNHENYNECFENNKKCKIAKKYPYVSSFINQCDYYISTLHIPNNINLNKLFVTVKYLSDEMICNSIGSYRIASPLNLSIGIPSDLCDEFLSYNRVYCYKKCNSDDINDTNDTNDSNEHEYKYKYKCEFMHDF